MTPLACLVLVVSGGCATPGPAPAVFVGKLQSETLTVAEPGEICHKAQAHAPPAPAGMESVCVSNACGWSDARLQVVEPIAGSVSTRLVRLRSELGEWCRPIFAGVASDPLLVATAGVNPQTGLSQFETYRLIEVAPGQQAFVPDPPALTLAPWPLDLQPLLKPIRPVAFKSVDRVSNQERADLLRLPYVCQEGTQLAYCKAVYLSDLKRAISAPPTSTRK